MEVKSAVVAGADSSQNPPIRKDSTGNDRAIIPYEPPPNLTLVAASWASMSSVASERGEPSKRIFYDQVPDIEARALVAEYIGKEQNFFRMFSPRERFADEKPIAMKNAQKSVEEQSWPRRNLFWKRSVR